MDGEDAMEESYMMKEQSVGESGEKEVERERERKRNREECIERERGTILFLR